MSSRERVGPNHHGRVSQPSSTGASRHETIYATSDHHRQRDNRHSHSEILETKFAAQAAEIDRLASDNRKLAVSHIALREDLTVANREVQVLRAHIRNIETDSDVQIRGTLDKIMKMEVITKKSESIRRELQLAHIEAHRLVREREELASQVQSKSKELKNLSSEAESVEESTAELERLREEHQRLRTSFVEDKSANVETVGNLKEMERNIIAAVKEIEKLRAEVARARIRAGEN